ncbi:hypothetical protein Goklo_012000 [Gossypium klotzschianum]|uniref:RNase H type-1 domain-containing protein n=1 Tax=Gossypium klotzschianum TaxID=34286 RepID=A0A7J8VBV7_9ROSI|nr:hypothetical protein [Gossypium klotzschianum]
MDSIAAEIGAIIIVLDVYLAMGWKGKGSLIIEIGSNEVFSWIENKRLRPWMLQSIFKDIKNRMDKVECLRHGAEYIMSDVVEFLLKSWLAVSV